METKEELIQVKKIIQGILKAKKNIPLYPTDNPISLKIIEETFLPITRFLEVFNKFTLSIKPQGLFYNEHCVYSKKEKDDNFTLFLFKDGLRELTIIKGFTQQEYIDFISIIVTDFQKDMLDDDVVTLLWEREFEHLTYVVDEEVYYEGTSELKTGESEKSIGGVRKEEKSDNLIQAFRDSLSIEEIYSEPIIPLDEEDMHFLSLEINQEGQSLIPKLVAILFEILYIPEDTQAFLKTIDLIGEALLYCIKKGDLSTSVNIINAIKSIKKKNKILSRESFSLLEDKISSLINTSHFTKELVMLIDTEEHIDTKKLSSVIRIMETSSLPYFIDAFGFMKTEKGQKIVSDILFYLGKNDFNLLAQGLSDKRWYVVKNILSIINRIGDKAFIEHIKGCLSHPDVRVRKEVVRTLGNLKTIEVLPILKNYLYDSEKSIRLEAIEALGKIKSASVKSILFYETQKKDFRDKDFIEKKKFYHYIASVPDEKMTTLFLHALKKRTIFGSRRNDETRACAAYALGVAGVTEALPLLEKTSKSKNTYLKSQSLDAIKKLKARLT